jgi:hypothetical protein
MSCPAFHRKRGKFKPRAPTDDGQTGLKTFKTSENIAVAIQSYFSLSPDVSPKAEASRRPHKPWFGLILAGLLPHA